MTKALHKRFTLFLLIGTLLVAAIATPIRSAAFSVSTTVNPTEDATTILQNPLMGFQDHDVHGTWWPFSTGYLRATATCDSNGKAVACGPLNWDRLNPQLDTYNFADIDLFISNMVAQKKFVQLRVRNVVGPGALPNIPSWAAFAGVTYSNGQEPWGGSVYPEIDYQKCVFLDLWGKLANELTRRYDANPAVSAVDIGSYGWYGEWFSGKTVLQRFPNDQTKDVNDPTLQQSIDARTRIIRMFTGGNGSGRCIDTNGQEKVVSYSYVGFKNKPVLINRGDQEDVQIGVSNGAGIRFDGVGANDSRNQDFRDRISGMIAQIWQTKPIMGEFGTPDYAPVDSGIMQRSLCFAREFHLSTIHNNFDSKPSYDFNPLWRELGYRIVLNQATYPSSASAGSPATFNFTWVNKGTSPAYSRYPLKLYFKPTGSNTVAAAVTFPNTDIRQILPTGIVSGSTDFMNCPKGTPNPVSIAENVTIPALVAGAYDMYFAFEEPVYGQPIQLALSSKDSAGLYQLGRINIDTNGVVPSATIPTTGTAATPTNTKASTSTPTNTATNTPGGLTKTATNVTSKTSTNQPSATSRATKSATLLPTATTPATKGPTSTWTSTPRTTTAPTSTPRATNAPTNTPKPTNTQVVTTGGSFKVQYSTSEVNSTPDNLAPAINIVNTGKATVKLNDLTIRYYFTRDNETSLKFYCDYADMGCERVTGHFVDLNPTTSDADCYLEVGFNTHDSLYPGAKTGEVLLRINRVNWSDFDQTNDYSFDATKRSFRDWSQVTLYQNGNLIWGVPPSATAAKVQPTVAALIAPTVKPTSAPVVAPVTPSVIESDNLNVQRIGNWQSMGASKASSGSYLYSSNPNDALSIAFTGTQIDVIYVKHPKFGTFALAIDGKMVQTVNAKADQKAFGVRATVNNLSTGTHILRIYPLNGIVAIDAFIATLAPGVLPPTNLPTPVGQPTVPSSFD